MSKMVNTKVAIVGAGTAGIAVAARLLRNAPYLKGEVTIIDPNENHYYQPLWTLVGAGLTKLEETARKQEDVIPEGAHWMKEAVTTFNPEENIVVTNKGTNIQYEYLVVAAGIQLNWGQVKGLKETIGKNGVVSNYTGKYAESTREAIENFEGGTAIFTQPGTPIKCAGAPQKVMYLADEAFRKSGVRHKTNIQFISGMPDLFPVKHYYDTLQGIVERKGIETMYHMELIEIDGPNKKATFQNSQTKETKTIDFDMIHVTPHMSAPDFIANSPIANEAGWVDVDMYTLRHQKYNNIFSAGDSSSLPTSRTGAAVRKQAPVLVENLLAAMNDKEMKATYNGYSSCPVVTASDKVVLVEFVYDYLAEESMPIDQNKERTSMFILKNHFLPVIYWNGMMKGTM